MLPFAGVLRWMRNEALKFTIARASVLMLLLLVTLIYAPFLANPLVFDDINVLNASNFLDHAFEFRLAPRWLAYSTLAHTHALTGGSITVMRLGNLLLHFANVVAVFALLHAFCMAMPKSHGDDHVLKSRSLIVSFCGAGLLAVHPIAVYGVGYLVQRSILMSTLFMLFMLIAYLRWLTTGRAAPAVWSAVWYLLSVMSKEHSIMAPAVALLMTMVIFRPSLLHVRRFAMLFSAYLAIAVLSILMVKGVLGSAYEPMSREMFRDLGIAGDAQPALAYPLSVITQSCLYFKYFFLWVLPNVNWMSVDMRESLATSLMASPYWLAAIGFLAYPLLATGMVLRGGQVGLAGWILAYPWLMFSTELSTIRIQEPFVLYRAYLWFPLFGALLPLTFRRVNGKFVALLMVPVFCLLIAFSWNRLQTFSDARSLWEDAAKLLVTGKEPGAGRIYYNRALALSAQGRKIEGLAELDRVLVLQPDVGAVHFARARINFDLKRYNDTLAGMNRAIELVPNNAGYFSSRAITLIRLGRTEEAMLDLRKSCDMKDLIGCFALEQQTKSEKPKS